ncbi:hypothetical protein [Rhodococcus koreensis]|uniref:hypothetical protein n=1 Tax=Rhodococcus koreensis TaxID=99653 RepID=UPI001980634B|nr:hypothetical protein [Rhodococcus koreensis]QSE84857.1 hypothetical protein JWS14_40110 [Rhodococcus koreensis]
MNLSLWIAAGLLAVVALVAVGSAIHARRQETLNTDPRWPMFDFASIARSYYDGLLLACMLRWCTPSEIWWGDTPLDQISAISALLARTRVKEDQMILFPELLLAAAQGKVPTDAATDAATRIATEAASWEPAERVGILCGLALMDESGLDIGSSIDALDA